MERRSPNNADLKNRLQEKILCTKESLALQHKQTGEELLRAEMLDDAEEIVRLALELTQDPGLKAELEKQLQEIHNHFHSNRITGVTGLPFW